MNETDIARVQAYLRATLGNSRIHIEVPKRKAGPTQRRFEGFARTTLSLIATGLLGVASSAFGAYEQTAYIGGVPIGSSQTPAPDAVSYEYAFSSAPQEQQATITFSSSPIASASMTSSVSNLLGESVLNGGGILRYTFEVTATPLTNVPINFIGVFSAFQNGQGSASQVSFDIFSTSSAANTLSTFALDLRAGCAIAADCALFTTAGANTSYTPSQPDQYSVNGTFQGVTQFLTDATGHVSGAVQLGAVANVRTFAGVAGASAFIDPHLEIDAAFLAVNPGAMLAITPGVGNQISPVPEPQTYALMLAGLFVVGAVRRRKR